MSTAHLGRLNASLSTRNGDVLVKKILVARKNEHAFDLRQRRRRYGRSCAELKIDETHLQRGDYGLGAVRCVEFAEDIVDMILNRRGRDAQIIGNTDIAHAAGQ